MAASAVLLAAKRVVDRKKVKLAYINALKDVHYLLLVEQAHVDMQLSVIGKSNKVMVRDVIRKESGLDLSGKNSISAIRRRLSHYEEMDD